jgi:hypothetical protein
MPPLNSTRSNSLHEEIIAVFVVNVYTLYNAPSMSEQQPEQLPAQNTTDTGSTPVEVSETKAERFVRRTLSEKEMSSPAVTQLILDERDRLQVEVDGLRVCQVTCNALSTEVAVLKEKLGNTVLIDIIFTVGFGVGVAILGFAQTKPVIYLAVVLIAVVCAVKIIQTIRQGKTK